MKNGNSSGPKIVSRSLPGPKGRRLVARDHRNISSSYGRVYPLVVTHGRGSLLWDVDGNRFLDFTAGIAVGSTGHAHPSVVRAIREQSGRFLHMSGSDFYYEPMVALAEKMHSITPGRGAKKSFFSNSGAEAVEAAMKIARYQTRRPLFLAFYGGFHGRTMGALSLTSSKAVQRKGFAPQTPQATHVPYADCKRCPFNLEFPSCKIACVDFIEETVFKKHTPPEDVAAMIVEPIQGEGGYIVPPPGYFEKLQALCRKYGILFVADEVQAGMGRTGKWMAIEHWKVTPDVVTVAKGVASGMPLGVTVSWARLMNWPSGSHASTFGGNPVSCVAALATIDLIEKKLLANVRNVGGYLHRELSAMVERHPSLGWVSGKGLMLAFEVVKKEGTNLPDPTRREAIVQEAFKRGLLLLGAGESAIRLSPPLVVTRAQAQIALEIIEDSVSRVESRTKRTASGTRGKRKTIRGKASRRSR